MYLRVVSRCSLWVIKLWYFFNPPPSQIDLKTYELTLNGVIFVFYALNRQKREWCFYPPPLILLVFPRGLKKFSEKKFHYPGLNVVQKVPLNGDKINCLHILKKVLTTKKQEGRGCKKMCLVIYITQPPPSSSSSPVRVGWILGPQYK